MVCFWGLLRPARPHAKLTACQRESLSISRQFDCSRLAPRHVALAAADRIPDLVGLDLHLLQDCFELRQDLFGFGEQLQPRWRIALSYEFIRRLWCRSLHAAVSRRPGQTPRTGLLIPTDVTLAGGATDVWIFQLAQGLTVATAAKVVLSGGARASNVFWQVSGAVDLATTGHLEGIVLGQTSITLHAGASINGRLLAQAAVTIDGSVVVEPAP